jgi:hypothetical protein
MRRRIRPSEKRRPFVLTTEIFASGHFLCISLGLDGGESLEVAFEFGVAAQISIDIASGSGHVLAGIYLKTKSTCRKPRFGVRWTG